MRRGHHGFGGWRSENPRHFRPRGAEQAHFRPTRSFALLETPRFPPFSHSAYRGPPPPYLGLHEDLNRSENHEINKFNSGNRSGSQHRQDNHDRSFKHVPRSNHVSRNRPEIEHRHLYKEPNYYESKGEQFYVNRMGDIDDRQPHIQQYSQNSFRQCSTSKTFSHEFKRYNFKDRGKLQHNYENEGTKNTSLEYSGHRPPSSDHYGSSAGPSIDSTSAYSRSVDDTVNIVRRRLQNRSEPQISSCHLPTNDEPSDNQTSRRDKDRSIEPRNRKKNQKQQIQYQNCDKIKNNIVDQLFKMDKDRIHKLMDNPSSSTKFEYAISSLITESRNSLNRHLRSVAEKSLPNKDFIQNDTNTIYEDTFMKQMQYVLEPQDTLFLEDIKPIVLAELNKVLQLDQLTQNIDNENLSYQTHDDNQFTQGTEDYPNLYDNQEYLINDSSNIGQDQFQQTIYAQFDSNIGPDQFQQTIYDQFDHENKPSYVHVPMDKNEQNLLFERRQNRTTDLEKRPTSYSHEREISCINRRKSRSSIDSKDISSTPLFDTNAEQFSEEEDPFAELDKQYHVAVDHNLIENDDVPKNVNNNQRSRTPIKREYTRNLVTPEKILESSNVKQDIESQIHNLAKTPLKLCLQTEESQDSEMPELRIKQELLSNNCKSISPDKNENAEITKIAKTPEANKQSNDIENSFDKSTRFIERKRTLDQKPSHRKEKRKKSEIESVQSNKQILNKNIIINVNDCAAKNSENCEPAKSIFNLFFSKNNDMPKDSKKLETEKSCTDKYVKRKDVTKKTKDKEETNRQTSSSNSIVSPKDNGCQLGKSDTKKLKTIDMFLEQPKKGNLLPVHKKPAITVNKIVGDKSKQKVVSPSKPQNTIKMVSKEIQTTQTSTTRYCQTDKKKIVTRAVQTESVVLEKQITKSTDAFERMKEIDLEIQALVQEKFKLYNSLESKPNKVVMENLGMTVLNVSPATEHECIEDLNADTIADEFTSIPVEELEKIALESVSDQTLPKITKHNQKVFDLDKKRSESPSVVKRTNKKSKTPNIEQTIKDNRPLEGIISLDSYEYQSKGKKKTKTAPKKKPFQKTKKAYNTSLFDIKPCSVVLTRVDYLAYFKRNEEVEIISIPDDSEFVCNFESFIEDSEMLGETIVNDDLQFDMLDVSEDIVIGDSCEVKSVAEKDVIERNLNVSEEIILDNSQSSADDAVAAETGVNEGGCKVFDYSADENLKRDSITVSGNADAVLAIECVDNNILAACLDGNVYYFSQDGQLISTLRGSNLAVTCLTIVKEKYETTVYTGSLDSRIRYYDLESGLEKGPECIVLSPIQTMDRAWDTVFVGTRTGFVLQFECKNNMLIPVSTVKFSEQSILALKAMKEGPRKVLLVAARSENVTIKDAQTGLLLRTLSGPKMTVYTLLFEDGKVFCGTSSHQIHVFDYSSGSHVGTHEGGKGAVCLRGVGGLLFAGCYDGCVYVYREGECQPFAQLRGPSLMLLSLAVIGNKIIAGYKDRSLYIWKIPNVIMNEMIL